MRIIQAIVRLPLALACLALMGAALQLSWAGVLQLQFVTNGFAPGPKADAKAIVADTLVSLDAFGMSLAMMLVATWIMAAFVLRPLVRAPDKASSSIWIDDVGQFRKFVFELLIIFVTLALFRSVLAGARLDVGILTIPALIVFVATLHFVSGWIERSSAARTATAVPPAKPATAPAVAAPAKPVAVAAPAKPPALAAPAKPAAIAAPAKPAAPTAVAAAAPAKPAVVAAKPVASPAAPAPAAKPVAAVPAKPAAAPAQPAAAAVKRA